MSKSFDSFWNLMFFYACLDYKKGVSTKVLTFALLFFAHTFSLFAEDFFDTPKFLDRPYTGSMNLWVGQRFFSSGSFGSENNFPKWQWPEVGATFGLMEFPFRIEPIVGVSYVFRESKELPTTVPSGRAQSVDTFRFLFLSSLLGLRWRAWEPSHFLLIPYAEAALTYRFGRFQKANWAATEKHSVTGGDFGGAFTLGFIWSFMTNPKTRDDLRNQWELKDYGLNIFGSYLPAGVFKHGLGNVKTTGGTLFGLGLILDW